MAVTKKNVKKEAEKVVKALKATNEEIKDDAKKAVETKTEEVKAKAADAKKTVEAKTEEVKKEVKAKATTAKKTVAKKAAAASTAAKKAVAKAAALPAQQVYVEFAGNQSDIDSVVAKARDKFVEDGHKASSIKNVRVYLKPEDNKAYYVINEKYAGEVDLF